MKAVIIAEKPSVAKNIADALKIKKGMMGITREIIILLLGHLVICFNYMMQKTMMKKWLNGKWIIFLLFQRSFNIK